MKLLILLFSSMYNMLWLLTTPFVHGTPINQAEKATIGNLGVPVSQVVMVKTVDEGNITIITGTHTKQTKQKDIQQELLKEVEKGNEQRKNANNMEENIPRPRKVANTASIMKQPLNTTIGHKTTNTTTTTTTTTKSKLMLAKPQIISEGVELNSHQKQSKLIELIQSEIVEHEKANQKITEIVLSTAPTTPLGVRFITNGNNLGTNASTTMTTTNVSLTTTTVKTTTTTKQTKPKVTFSGDIHPEWDIFSSNKINVESKVTSFNIKSLPAAAAGGSTTGSLSVITPKIATIVANNLLQQYEPPQVQPSQEKIISSINTNDNIVNFFTIIVTLPLAIGVGVTIYRRFRAFWSTRHYHRMDFLVDGMYND